jgi:hypothetical protein
MSDEEDYDVGYKKPPKHTRFQPGQSGNPKGRLKKHTKDLQKLIDQELSKTIRINENGETRIITKREGLVKRLIQEAFQGNHKARQMLVKFAERNVDIDSFEPDSADQEALEAFLSEFNNAEEEGTGDGSENASD